MRNISLENYRNTDWISRINDEVSTALQPVLNSFSQVCARIENETTPIHHHPELLSHNRPPILVNSNFQGMIMYATVYNIATNQQYMSDDEGSLRVCELLYSHYQEILSSYANQLATKCTPKATLPKHTTIISTKSLSSQSGGDLSALSRVRAWSHYQIASKWMQITFGYLSRYFLGGDHNNDFSKYPSLRECSHAVFFNCVLKMHVSETRDAVFALLTAARSIRWAATDAAPDTHVDFTLCKRSVEMFRCMNIRSQSNFFSDHFFTPYVELTNKAYVSWARQKIPFSSAEEYVNAASEVIQSEKVLCSALFSLGAPGSSDDYYTRLMEEIHKDVLETDEVQESLFPIYYQKTRESLSGLRGVDRGLDNQTPYPMQGGTIDRTSRHIYEPLGFANMLHSRNYASISLLFALCSSNVKRLEPLAVTVTEHLYEEGLALLGHSNAPISDAHLDVNATITNLGNLYYTYQSIVKECMSNHVMFVKAVREGLQRVVAKGCMVCSRTNDSPASYKGFISIGELLAKYSDIVIRRHDKVTDRGEIETSLNLVVTLLLLDQNKDHFQNHAKELLVGRLLSPNASFMEGFELYLLESLRSKLGQQYTSLMDTMIKDKATVSSDVNRQFIEYMRQTKGTPCLNFEIYVSTLRVGVWPVNRFIKHGGYLLPPTNEVREALCTYERFYHDVFKKRSLQWVHHLSTAVLTVFFGQSGSNSMTSKDMTMTAHQAAILLVWQDTQQEEVTHTKPFHLKPINIMSPAILQRLGISADEVRKALHGLLKTRLLGTTKRKMSSVAETSDGGIPPFFIAFNEHFSSPSRKVVVHNNYSAQGGNATSIALGSGVSAQVSLSAVEERARDVALDRRPAIKAALVRVMKSRGELGHQELVSISMQQLSSLFVVDGKVVKGYIEELIDTGILERNPSTPNVYRYVA